MDYDVTGLPAVYREARALATENLDIWRDAIRTAVPAGASIRRAVDVGCGTGRFTAVLAGLFDAPVASAEYLAKIRLRGISSLAAIPDEAFARGLEAFARHCRAAGRRGAVLEPVDLYVFERAPGGAGQPARYT